MLHQFSHKLVNEHAAIFVGNVNAKALHKLISEVCIRCKLDNT
jgi:hypothetical protein